MNKLLELLELESEQLSVLFKKSSIEGKGTPQEVADRNEGYFISFLKKYFPFPYRIVKGIIVDSYGNKSKSIDCIVLNPSHPYTIDENNHKASVILADGVDYAIEIKSELTSKTEINRALKQVQSVKQLRRIKDGIIFRKNLSESQLKYRKTIPTVLVADATYSDVRLLLKTVADYYVNNKVEAIEQVDLILINNSVLIYNIRPDSYLNLNNERILAFAEADKKSLALFLFELNQFPHCEPTIGEDILSIYLRDIRPDGFKHFVDIDKMLEEAGV